MQLTSHLIGKNSLDPRVMVAMKSIPRQDFLPANFKYIAYENHPAPIGSGQTICQPLFLQWQLTHGN